MNRSLVYVIYNLLLPLALLVGFPRFVMKGLQSGGLARNFRQRLGLYQPEVKRRLARERNLWIHAVSVGEVLVASAVGGQAEVGIGWVVLALPSSAAPRVVAGQQLVLLGNGATLCDGVVTSPESGSTIEVAVPPGCAAPAAVHAAANTLTAAIRL